MQICGVSVKSITVLESSEHFQLLLASSDGYIKLYDVSVEVCECECCKYALSFFVVAVIVQYLVHYNLYIMHLKKCRAYRSTLVHPTSR